MRRSGSLPKLGSIVGHADRSGDLRRFLHEGKKIVITTVQKFPFVLDEIGDEHRGRKFGIMIDEAHSSQGGRTSASISVALGDAGAEEEEETLEDEINRIMESKRMLSNASYFAFTATPKNRTLEIFGTPVEESGGVVQACAVSLVHDEAGDTGGVHRRCLAALHAD